MINAPSLTLKYIQSFGEIATEQFTSHTAPMADQQLQAQLDTLQEVLGKTITFDPSKKTSATEREVSLRETSRPSDWQEQHLTCEKPPCGETVPSLVACASAATVPADTEAWDDVTLRPGDSLDPGVAMCPWKRIEKYPLQFIGKRNRPLVRSCA